MENTNNIESGFIIKSMVLLESSFHRINTVTFNDSVKNHIEIKVDVSINGNVITVCEIVELKQSFQDVEQISILIKMVGVFEKNGDSPILDMDSFGRINGAAIIYPYIREHITNLTLKAGIGPIILPPVNFTLIKQEKDR